MPHMISRWFAKLLPISPLLETTQQREQHRKASLLTLVLLVNFSLSVWSAIGYIFTGPLLAEIFLLIGTTLTIGVLWLNRRGHFKIAAWFYLGMIFTSIICFTVFAPQSDFGDGWGIFLALPTLMAGVFLSAWVPWCFGIVDCLLVTTAATFAQFHIGLDRFHMTLNTLTSFYFVFMLIALIGSLYAWSIDRAVRQADRAEELELANTELQMLQEELFHNNDALHVANARLEATATTDPLTVLPNHRAMAHLLEDAILQARQQHQHFALLFCDIDHFKSINDSFGHNAGDIVLQQFAQTVQMSVRQSDAVGLDVVGRWGGEEFIVLLHAIQEDHALQVAERVCSDVAARTFPIGNQFHLTCSIGVACYPQDGDNEKKIVDAADRAMYRAKQSGRNRVCRASDLSAAMQSPEAITAKDSALSQCVDALAAVLAVRDGYTGGHSEAVGMLLADVAREMGSTAAEIEPIVLAGRLHDVGKVGIPDAILNKPGQLTPREWQVMRTHPAIGAEIVTQFPGLSVLAPIIHAHHERWDGQGYPDGLVGEAIPLGSRIIAVVDTYNAMTTTRPYSSARPPDEAMAEILRCSGTQFDPHVVTAFLRVLAAKQRLARAA